MSARANGKLEMLLADAHERITPLVRSERYRRAAYLSIPPGQLKEEPAPRNPSARWLAVVDDNLGLGPAGFHMPSLQLLVSRATHLAVVIDATDPRVCRVFAGTAVFCGRLLVIEAQLPLYAAWERFMLEHSTRVVLSVRESETVLLRAGDTGCLRDGTRR